MLGFDIARFVSNATPYHQAKPAKTHDGPTRQRARTSTAEGDIREVASIQAQPSGANVATTVRRRVNSAHPCRRESANRKN